MIEKLTREELIEKIKNRDVEWFQKYYFAHEWSAERNDFAGNKFKVCWEINWGDGNEWIVALDFFEENVTVVMEGCYSSHGESEFSEVGLGIPYEFKETRYRIATKQDLRDLKLEEILNG
jgi:hypothetical protein